jgi:hypothetical protein
MKYNQPLQDIPVSLWRRITAFINVVLLTFYACLPGTVAAYEFISEAFIASEINNNPQFQLSINSDYLVEKAYYVTDTTSTSTQTIASFHQKLLDHRKTSLPVPLMIPIMNGDITIIIPHYPLEKLIGDSFVQSRFVRSQIFNQLNRNLLNDSIGTEAQQINALYNQAFDFSATSTKRFGEQLTRSEINTFGKNLIWPELRNVNGQTILVPVVHLTDVTINEQLVNGHIVEFGGAETQFNNITINAGTLNLRRNTLLNVAGNLNINEGAKLKSSHDLNVLVGGTLQNISGQISAEGNAYIIAGQYLQKTMVHRYATKTTQGSRLGQIASVDANGNIYIKTSGDLVVKGGTISGNNIRLQADGNIVLQSQETTYVRNEVVHGWNESESIIQQLGSQLTAEENIQLLAAGAIEINASTLHADKGHIELLAGLGVSILDAQGLSQSSAHRKHGNLTVDESSYVTVAIRAVLDAGKGVKIHSELGDITLRATDISSTEGTSVNAANGAINMLMTVENDQYNYNSVKKSLFTIKTVNRGHNYETPVPNSIIGGFTAEALYGVKVQYEGEPSLSLDEQIAKIGDMPGLDWMADVRSKYPDADWEAVNIIYDDWDKSSTTLSPAALAVIIIIVTVVTAGAGSVLAGAATTTGAAVGGASAAQIAMYNAAFTSLISTSAVASANVAVNGGNPVEALTAGIKAVASEEGIKSLATSVVTAGALASINSEFFTADVAGAQTQALELGLQGAEYTAFIEAAQSLSFGQQVTQALTHATVQAGISTIIYGGDLGDFKDSLVQALAQSAINQLGEKLATEIGLASKPTVDPVTGQIIPPDINQVTRYIAHAATGCLTGSLTAAVNGSEGDAACASGAGGAVVGEAIGDLFVYANMDEVNTIEGVLEDELEYLTTFGENSVEGQMYLNALKEDTVYYHYLLDSLKAEGVDLAQLGAAMTAFIAGADAGNIYIAGNAGENAASNNAIPMLVWGGIALVNAIGVYFTALDMLALGEKIIAAEAEGDISGDYSKRDELLKLLAIDAGIEVGLIIVGGKAIDSIADIIQKARQNGVGDEVIGKLEVWRERTAQLDGEMVGHPPVVGGVTDYDPRTSTYYDYENLSTARPNQATVPRDDLEQALWDFVLVNPSSGKPLDLSGDGRFSNEAGWTKMQVTDKYNGQTVTIHYQYNSYTNKAYDIKITTPQRY